VRDIRLTGESDTSHPPAALMKQAIQFGAGNIGRGFLGQLFYESGYRTVFVDVDRDLVTRLNREGAYPLDLVEMVVSRIKTLTGSQHTR